MALTIMYSWASLVVVDIGRVGDGRGRGGPAASAARGLVVVDFGVANSRGENGTVFDVMRAVWADVAEHRI